MHTPTIHRVSTQERTEPFRYATLLTTALIFCCYLPIFYYTPAYADDLCFLKDYVALTGSDQATPTGIIQFFDFLWHTENGRLPNLLFMGLYILLFNKFLSAVLLSAITTGAIYVIAKGAQRATNKCRVDFVTLILAWALIVVGMKWSNMFIGALILNYVLTTWLDITVIMLIVQLSHVRISKRRLIATMILAFAAGWMHDGFSAVVLGGIGTWVLIRRFHMPAQVWCVIAAFTIGFILTLTSPMIWMRFQLESHAPIPATPVLDSSTDIAITSALSQIQTATGGIFRIMRGIRQALTSFPFFTALCLLWGCMLLIKRWRPKFTALWHNPFMVIYTAGSVIGILMWLILARGNSGVSWAPQIMALMALLITLKTLDTPPAIRKFFSPVAVMTMTTLVIFFTCVAFRTHHINKEYNEIIAEIKDSPHGTVFRDIDNGHDKWLLSYPPSQIWRSDPHIFAINYYSPQPINVVPKSLENFSSNKAAQLEGNSGIRSYAGHLIAPDEQLIYARFNMPCRVPMDYCDYIFIPSDKHNTPRLILCKRLLFTASDGSKWLYITTPTGTPLPPAKAIYRLP